jgi:hypothetical protein
MSEKSTTPPAQPVVDPSPTQAPIHLGSTEYVFPPAAASPPEVLELKPNRHADAVSGPDPQVSSIGYTTWTRPDGGTFVAPVANDETYERKGFTKGKTEDIPDLVQYLADNAAKTPKAPKTTTSESS